MTGTWFLIGSAIGFTATLIWGFRRTTRIYSDQLNREPWPLESDGIYDWAHDWDQLAADELEGWQA